MQAETVTRERDEQITSITAELEAIKLRERELRGELSQTSSSAVHEAQEKDDKIVELSQRVAELENVSARVDELKQALISANAATKAAAQSIEETESELAQERKRIGAAEEELSRTRESAKKRDEDCGGTERVKLKRSSASS